MFALFALFAWRRRRGPMIFRLSDRTGAKPVWVTIPMLAGRLRKTRCKERSYKLRDDCEVAHMEGTYLRGSKAF